jgi:hypothetical protein
MSNGFTPRLDIFPNSQRRLWPELGGTPILKNFLP